MGDEDQGIPLRDDERETEVIFHHRADHDGKDQGGHLKLKLSCQVSEDSKSNHQADFDQAVIEAVNSNEAEEKNEREKDGVGNPQDLHPEPDQGKVENQEHDIAQIHAHDRSPEEVGMFGDDHGAGLNAMDHEGPQKDGNDRVDRYAQRKKWNEGPSGSGIVGRLRAGDTFNDPRPEFFRMFGELLLNGIGSEGGDDRRRSWKDSNEEAEERPPDDGPEGIFPVLKIGQQVFYLRRNGIRS